MTSRIFKNSHGFTLIELMIVVAIIGILSSIAIPVYQNYLIRVKVSEGFSLASNAQTAVSDYYNAMSTFPTSNTIAGIPTSITSTYVTSIVVTGSGSTSGTVTITYNDSRLGTGTANPTIILVATPSSAGRVVWTCTGGTMPNQFRPSNCRT